VPEARILFIVRGQIFGLCQVDCQSDRRRRQNSKKMANIKAITEKYGLAL